VTRDYYAPNLYVDKGRYESFASASPDTVVADIEAALQQGIYDRLVSDVPVGTLCSGGLDSSLVTAMAARHTQQLTAFHVSVSGYTALDEKAHAEALTRDLGIPLISYALTGETYRRELPRAIYMSDLPLSYPNSVAYFLICQVARAHGVIVLLSGEGADELFGGYAWRYRNLRRLLHAQRWVNLLPQKIRKRIAMAGYACAGLPVTSIRFDELLPQTVAFIDRYARREWHLQCEDAYAFVTDPIERAVLGAILSDLSNFLTPLLRRLDRMSMGTSIECRVPFLDHRLVHQAINLHLTYRVNRRADKWVLKQIASRYLPDRLVTRKKMGFPLPLQDYLAPLAHSELFMHGFCHEVLALSPRSINESMGTWQENPYAFLSLVSLEIWGRLFILREPLEQVSELIAKLEHQYAHAA
jgi:asparagine synthase (glutamine-hydrolysing)